MLLLYRHLFFGVTFYVALFIWTKACAEHFNKRKAAEVAGVMGIDGEKGKGKLTDY